MSDPKNQKFLIVCSNRWNSAITEFALSLASSLILNGKEVFFLCKENTPAYMRAKLIKGLKVKVFKDFSILKLKKMAQLTKAENFDVAVSFEGQEATLLGLCRRRFWHIRFFGRSSHLDPNLITKKLLKATLYQYDQVLFPSVQYQNSFLEHQDIKNDGVVELGRATELFYVARQGQETEDSQKKILVFGRFDPVKNHRLAFKMLKSLDASVTLTCIGKAANLTSNDLLKFAKLTGVESQVEIIESHIEEYAQMFAQYDLCLIPSFDSEVICRVAEESLMCGCAVLSSDVGSFPSFQGMPGFEMFLRGELTEKKQLKLKSMLEKYSRFDLESRMNISAEATKRFSLQAMASSFLDFVGRANV